MKLRFVGLLLAGGALLNPTGAVAYEAPPRALMSDSLPAWLRSVATGPLMRAHWGVAVYDLGAQRWVAEHNADRFFMPASNLKLVVSAVALDRLGPDYHYRTSLHATAPPGNDGTIDGDLILYGRGDPNLSGRHAPSMTSAFEWFADSLARRGIRRIDGDLIADESHWDADYYHPDWTGFDRMWWYAAPVGALGFNDNSVDIRFHPAKQVGQPPVLQPEPKTDHYVIENLALTAPAGASSTFDLVRAIGDNRITAFGELPLDHEGDVEYVAIVDAAAYAGKVFRDVLANRGIEVRGTVRTLSDPERSPVARGMALQLATHVSPPLSDVLAAVNGRSQNWHAEQLLKTLGKELRDDGGWEAGRAVENETLDHFGVDTLALRIQDASGLAATNLATPRAFVDLLVAMSHHRHADVFAGSLPVAGVSGSLRARLDGDATRGRVRAKTGFIENVYALSGYLTTHDDREYAFSILVNGAPDGATKAIDQLVKAFVLGKAP